MSNGKIIGILHSDDEFIDEDIIEIISKKFLENNLDVLFSNIFYTEKNNINKITRKWTSDLTEGIQQNNPLGYALFNNYIAPVLSKPSIATLRLIFQDNDGGISGYVSD